MHQPASVKKLSTIGKGSKADGGVDSQHGWQRVIPNVPAVCRSVGLEHTFHLAPVINGYFAQWFVALAGDPTIILFRESGKRQVPLFHPAQTIDPACATLCRRQIG